jgi:hypothetical protein
MWNKNIWNMGALLHKEAELSVPRQTFKLKKFWTEMNSKYV